MFPRLLKIHSSDLTITFKVRRRKRLDLTICEDVRRIILSKTAEHFYQVNLDLSDIDFIDSAAINMLMTLNEDLKKRGCGFSIVNVSEQVLEILDLTQTLKDLILEKEEQKV